MTAVGEILARGHAQLEHFCLSELNFRDNAYPQFWRGLAVNRVLKEVRLDEVDFPNEPDATRFPANPELESLHMKDCTFPDGTFDSFCQGVQSSLIKKLEIIFDRLPRDDYWSLLWPALDHGATRLESLNMFFQRYRPRYRGWT